MKKAPPAPRPRGRPRSFDRDTALQRAMEVFWRQGYEATSLADLTGAMGINPPSLYAAFGDKKRLFLEAVDRYRCGSNAARIFAEEPTAYAGMRRLLGELASEATKPGRPAGCMIVLSALNCSADAGDVQAKLADLRAANEAGLKARLQRALAAGELARGTDVAALAKFYATVINGLAIQARDGASRAALAAVVETALRAWPQR